MECSTSGEFCDTVISHKKLQWRHSRKKYDHEPPHPTELLAQWTNLQLDHVCSILYGHRCGNILALVRRCMAGIPLAHSYESFYGHWCRWSITPFTLAVSYLVLIGLYTLHSCKCSGWHAHSYLPLSLPCVCISHFFSVKNLPSCWSQTIAVSFRAGETCSSGSTQSCLHGSLVLLTEIQEQ